MSCVILRLNFLTENVEQKEDFVLNQEVEKSRWSSRRAVRFGEGECRNVMLEYLDIKLNNKTCQLLAYSDKVSENFQ